jgi:hypothetical protein
MPTLTRQELYDLVWSTPMTKLAETFGISDVGLAKICDRHRVPTPPRGYWAKKEAGHKVKQAIFVQADDPLLDRIDIAPARDNIPEPVREIIELRRAERKASQPARLRTMITPPKVECVTEPHPAIRATALALRRAQPSKPGIVEAIGPGLCGISVGIKSIERIIFILDRLARACENRGLALTPKGDRIAAAIAADEVTFVINEKPKQIGHVLTEAEIAAEEKRRKRNEQIARGRSSWDDYSFDPLPPKFDTIRTGALGIQIYGWGNGLRRSWNDGKTQTVETLLDDFIDALEAQIATVRLRREAQELAEAAEKELERRRDLANARRHREGERKRLLQKLIRTEQQVAQLRNWIATHKDRGVIGANTDTDRMFEWVLERLAALEAVLDPINLAEELRVRKLFPESDELHDPLGDPPPEKRYW